MKLKVGILKKDITHPNGVLIFFKGEEVDPAVFGGKLIILPYERDDIREAWIPLDEEEEYIEYREMEIPQSEDFEAIKID